MLLEKKLASNLGPSANKLHSSKSNIHTAKSHRNWETQNIIEENPEAKNIAEPEVDSSKVVKIARSLKILNEGETPLSQSLSQMKWRESIQKDDNKKQNYLSGKKNYQPMTLTFAD